MYEKDAHKMLVKLTPDGTVLKKDRKSNIDITVLTLIKRNN
jgi:hypothetical protein